MDLNIKDKVFLVAASSKGLGYGIVQELARNGSKVSIGSRNFSHVENAVMRLREESNAVVHGSVLDATEGTSISQWVKDSVKVFGRIDGLVVNAGGPPTGRFENFNDADWQSAFNLTLMSAVRMIREALPYMRTGNGGSVLTITSMSVKEPIGELLLSNVFRSGVVSLVKSLATQYAAEGIRFNNLIPGRIDTERVKALDKGIAEMQGVDPEAVKHNNQSIIPLKRYGTIEEFGKAGAFLLSDAASYITGTSLVVDGGILKSII